MQDDIVRPPVAETPTAPPVDSSATTVQDVVSKPETLMAAPLALAESQEAPNPSADEEKIGQKENHDTPPQQPTASKPKSRIPKAAIVAGLICISVVGAVVYVAVNGGVEQKVGNAKTPSSKTTQSNNGTTSQNELNSLSNEASTLPDPGTDPTSDLTDQALGL